MSSVSCVIMQHSATLMNSFSRCQRDANQRMKNGNRSLVAVGCLCHRCNSLSSSSKQHICIGENTHLHSSVGKQQKCSDPFSEECRIQLPKGPCYCPSNSGSHSTSTYHAAKGNSLLEYPHHSIPATSSCQNDNNTGNELIPSLCPNHHDTITDGPKMRSPISVADSTLNMNSIISYGDINTATHSSGIISEPNGTISMVADSSYMQQQQGGSDLTGSGRQEVELEQFIVKRNERERWRVRNVNEAFDNLKNALPLDMAQMNKRMSKVEILRAAIDYIKHLDVLLRDSDNLLGQSSQRPDE